MKTTKLFGIACIALAAAACTARGASRPSDPHAQSAGLACGELAQSGATRPFENDSSGVDIRELRAADLPTYDRTVDDLPPDAPVGIRYSVAAASGSSTTWLERQIRCYRVARAGSSALDPLLVADASVSVSASSGRYLVDVTSEDRKIAAKVLRAAGR